MEGRNGPCIVGLQVAIPPALLGVLRVYLPVVDFEVVVRVPANSQARLLNGFMIVQMVRVPHER